MAPEEAAEGQVELGTDQAAPAAQEGVAGHKTHRHENAVRVLDEGDGHGQQPLRGDDGQRNDGAERGVGDADGAGQEAPTGTHEQRKDGAERGVGDADGAGQEAPAGTDEQRNDGAELGVGDADGAGQEAPTGTDEQRRESGKPGMNDGDGVGQDGSKGADEQRRENVGIRIGDGARVGTIDIKGDVAGRDIVNITEERTFDVTDLSGNPYRGLATFGYAEAAFFGGREQQIGEAVALLTQQGAEPSLVFVTGASGSGKSSFVQAGVVPALEQHYGGALSWGLTRPGRKPREAIENALTKLDAKSARLLVLDQFEEVFTQAESAERENTCAWLIGLKSFAQSRMQVIATLRSDYLSAIFDQAELLKVFKTSGIELRAMDQTELARAIEQPLREQARRDQRIKRWQPGLVQRLVEDVGSDATLLPLLQVTCTSLWDEPPHTLTLDRYRTLTDALERQAERVYGFNKLGQARTTADQQVILQTLLDLVEVSLDSDEKRDVRRTVSKTELSRGDAQRTAFIDELVDTRLLSITGDQVDIIHETLLRNWPRLREAVAQQREMLQARVRMRLALREWLEHDKADDYLIEGVRLAEARALATQQDIVFTDSTATEFLARSNERAHAEQERELEQARTLATEQQARAQESASSARRLRRWLIATAVLAIAAVAAAAIAVFGFVRADQQVRINASRELAAQAQAQQGVDSDLSILLAREALRKWNSTEGDTALRSSLASSTARLVLRLRDASITAATYNGDGTRVVEGASDGSLRLVDASTGDVTMELAKSSGPITLLGYSEDGARFFDSNANGETRVWSKDGQLLTTVQSARVATFSRDGALLASGANDGNISIVDLGTGTVTNWQSAPVSTLAFSPDGRLLITGGLDGMTRLWQWANAADARLLKSINGTQAVASLAFDPAGQKAVTVTQAGAHVWSVDGDQDVVWSQAGLRSAQFSPDGQLIVSASNDGTARLWDVASGTERAVLRGHSGPVESARFSKDGLTVLTASQDGTAWLWDTRSATSLLQLRGHAKAIRFAQASADGTRALTTSLDGSARIWDLTAGSEWLPLRGHTGKVLSAAFSPDGQHVATAGADSTWRIWSENALPDASVQNTDTFPTSVAYSPDGRRLAIGTVSGAFKIVDAGTYRTGEVGSTLYTIVFSPDGGSVLTATKDGVARMWSVSSGELQAELNAQSSGDVINAVFSPDQKKIATASSDGTARIWDVASRSVLQTINAHTGRVNRLRFSPNGQQLVTIGDDGMLKVWDASSGRGIATVRHGGALYALAISPDGQLVVSGGADRRVVVWDARTWQQIAELRGSLDEVYDASFSPDGQKLVVASADSQARVYPREMFAPQAEVLQLLPRRVMRQPAELTTDERLTYLHE